MGGSNNWRQAQTFDEAYRQHEKRTLSQERRPQVRTAADILGPGFAPFSVEIFDWNADEGAFNGLFHSAPGAINSPDEANGKWFMGHTQGTEDGFGLQTVTEFRDIPGNAWPSATWQRRFFDPGSAGTRSYSRWAMISDPTPLGDLRMHYTETPPSDRYLFADGREILRVDYPELTQVYQDAGFPFGVGDGVTTIAIPDQRSRFPQGSDATIGRLVGATEGINTPDDRLTRHTHGIPEEGQHTDDSWQVPNTGGNESPRIVDYRNHDHSGDTEIGGDTFPRVRWAFHVRVLP